MHDQGSTIRQFLDAAAARQPTPGGGSVTALAGALAAAMGEMVVNYSVGKKSLAMHAETLRAALGELTRARQVLLQLMVEDQLAYEALTSAKKLPEDSPERRDRLPAALLASIRGPQAIGAAAVAVLQLCDRLVDVVNYNLLSDLAVSADLAMATARCAAYNVRVNLPDVPDDEERRLLASGTEKALSHALGLIRRVAPRIWARHEAGE